MQAFSINRTAESGPRRPTNQFRNNMSPQLHQSIQMTKYNMDATVYTSDILQGYVFPDAYGKVQKGSIIGAPMFTLEKSQMALANAGVREVQFPTIRARSVLNGIRRDADLYFIGAAGPVKNEGQANQIFNDLQVAGVLNTWLPEFSRPCSGGERMMIDVPVDEHLRTGYGQAADDEVFLNGVRTAVWLPMDDIMLNALTAFINGGAAVITNNLLRRFAERRNIEGVARQMIELPDQNAREAAAKRYNALIVQFLNYCDQLTKRAHTMQPVQPGGDMLLYLSP